MGNQSTKGLQKMAQNRKLDKSPQ